MTDSERPWRPRLVALDVDGTLLEPGGEILEPVKKAITAATAAGARIVLATGRSAIETAPLIGMLGLDRAYAVCSNGAVTVVLPETQIVEQVTFQAGDVVARLLAVLPDARVAVEEPGLGYGVTEYFPQGELLGPQRLRPLSTMMAEPVTRVVVRDVSNSVADFARLVASLDLSTVSYAVGYRAWLDLVPHGVTKGSGLAALAARLGVAADDCLAIGDGHNDIEMLTWAGRGVAMGQAPKEVRAAADDVTGIVQTHGVATELARWFQGAE